MNTVLYGWKERVILAGQGVYHVREDFVEFCNPVLPE